MNIPPSVGWVLYIAIGAIIGVPLVFHIYHVVADFWGQF